MPTLDLADETYIAVPPSLLAPELTAPVLLAAWFPSLSFEVFMDRGEKGTRWSVTGEVDGSVEVWLEPMGRGTLVHWFLRGEPSDGRDDVGNYLDVVNARMFMFKDDAEARHLEP